MTHIVTISRCVVWALVVLCTSTIESEVFVLEDHISATVAHRHKLHAVHPRLGDAQVDGQIQMRKETAEVAVRTAERDLTHGVTVLRAARSKAQSRVRDAHSDAESLAAAKANFASKVEDNEAAETELQTVRSEAAKEKAKLVTEEAREEHGVLLAKAREQRAAETLTAANHQLEKGSKLSEASIAHAEQGLQDKTLQVQLTQEHTLTTRIEAERWRWRLLLRAGQPPRNLLTSVGGKGRAGSVSSRRSRWPKTRWTQQWQREGWYVPY